jgi:hypothetical protein
VLIAPFLAALVVGLSRLLGWQGVDYAAQIYRVDSFRAHGFALWDFQWYAGNWTINYSVLFPSLASTLGVATVTVLSAAGAALAFDRLAVGHFGRPGRVASLVFAVGTVVPAAIGQLPFLTGEAFGLGACWAVARRRWGLAAALALASALCSPLTGAFVAMAVAAWALSRWRAGQRDRLLMSAGMVMISAAAPVAATAVLFPGTGAMPYPFVDFVWEMAIAAGLWLAAGRQEPVLRMGLLLYAAAAAVSIALPSPLGGNIGRLEDAFAFPLAVALLVPRWTVLVPLATVPLVLSQWGPAWGVLNGAAAAQPSTHESYFAPLDAALRHYSAGAPAGRVEVVPTEYHWEAAYVAPVMPLARGWERQLDVADNPVFYRPGALSAGTYRSWLLNDGVTFVALPDAPLDAAGQAEGRLVSSGRVPGLHLIWRSTHWEVYSVAGSQGIVSGPAQLLSAKDGQVVVEAVRPGPVLIRIRYNSDWVLSDGTGCIRRGAGSWIRVDVYRAELLRLRLSLLGGGRQACAPPAGTVSAPATTGRVPTSPGPGPVPARA